MLYIILKLIAWVTQIALQMTHRTKPSMYTKILGKQKSDYPCQDYIPAKKLMDAFWPIIKIECSLPK